MSLTEQRISKIDQLKKLNINPYPAEKFKSTGFSTDFKTTYSEGKQVVASGRLMSRRIQGNASFAELLDSKDRIQLYLNRDEICLGDDKTQYNVFYKKLLDIGDIIGVSGKLFKTKVGEITILVKEITLLSKSIRPLPLPKMDKDGVTHDEFTNPELRYRQRYVDLIVNPSVKNVFVTRTKIINSIRDFFNSKGYLEVETPILQPIPGGASARPFTTHHNALDIPLYMRIANELYLKRLIVGGFEGVYEFAKNFRNEGMDRTHNPEFTIMELYVAYKDYFWMMTITEILLEKLAKEIFGSSKVKFQNKEINFTAPFSRVSIYEAIQTHTGIDVSTMSEDEIFKLCKKLNLSVDRTMGKGKLIDELFSEQCEKHYIQPTFIIDYPKEMSPLTKTHRSNPNLTERFELFINGNEIANAYSELNDPIDQKKRFEEQFRLMERGDNEAMFIDNDFLRALEYGMPPTSGIGIGIDRLVMLLTNNISIQEVLLFPQMKPEKTLTKLTEEAKLIIKTLQGQKDISLEKLKSTLNLSNKKWDKSLKELKNNNLVSIYKKNKEIRIKSES